MFWGYFAYAGTGILVPDDGTMNDEIHSNNTRQNGVFYANVY